jgi:hypothetical protein
MKVSDSIFNWPVIGATVANLGDDNQADFLVGFANELSHWDPKSTVDMQFLAVGKRLKEKLTKEDKYTLIQCLECIIMELNE